MTRTRSKVLWLLLIVWIVGATAKVAMAQFFVLPVFGRFSFSFFNSFLNNVFLFPFTLGGC